MNGADSPVFVRGLSRSGGTLVVTILDAHPRIAMSYEQYPDLLVPRDGPALDAAELARGLAAARDRKEALKTIPDKDLHTFFARVWRGGLDHRDAARLLEAHLAAGRGLASMEDRLRYIEALCREKMHRERKARWGLKCEDRFGDYLALWPEASFINIVRDGRDVLASQLNTGAFHPDPAELGRSWSRTVLGFRQAARESHMRAHEIVYERLVASPAEEVRLLCAFLGEEFHRGMLDFHRRDLTIYKANHLSMDRISKPIDDTRVGRWQEELSPEQVAAFLSTAREAMTLLGYV